jgi:hypothetical protein
MLNMKKGLAIVLAAATALTFAPVSTLGLQGVVEAQAAETKQDASATASVVGTTSVAAGTTDKTLIGSTGTLTLTIKNTHASDDATSVEVSVVSAKGENDTAAGTPASGFTVTGSPVTKIDSNNGTATVTIAAGSSVTSGNYFIQVQNGSNYAWTPFTYQTAADKDAADAAAASLSDAKKASFNGVESAYYLRDVNGTTATIKPNWVVSGNAAKTQYSGADLWYTLSYNEPGTSDLTKPTIEEKTPLKYDASNEAKIELDAAKGSLTLKRTDNIAFASGANSQDFWLSAYKLNNDDSNYTLVGVKKVTLAKYANAAYALKLDQSAYTMSLNTVDETDALDKNVKISKADGSYMTDTEKSAFLGSGSTAATWTVSGADIAQEETAASAKSKIASKTYEKNIYAVYAKDTKKFYANAAGSTTATVTITSNDGKIAQTTVSLTVIGTSKYSLLATVDGSATAAVIGAENDAKNGSDNPVVLDTKVNKTYDLASHIYKSAAMDLSYESSNAKNTVNPTTGLVTATTQTDSFYVTVKGSVNGTIVAMTKVYFKVNSLPFDTVNVTGVDKDAATTLGQIDYDAVTRNVGGNGVPTEQQLAASQIKYVQIETTGAEPKQVTEALNIVSTGGAVVSASLVNQSSEKAFTDVTSAGVVTLKKSATNGVAVIKLVSAPSANTVLTTSYIFVVVDKKDAKITAQPAYKIGTCGHGTNGYSLNEKPVDHQSKINFGGYAGVKRVQVLDQDDDLLSTKTLYKDAKDINKNFVQTYASGTGADGRVISDKTVYVAKAEGKTEKVLVSYYTGEGTSYQIVTITSVAGVDNSVTKIEDANTGKVIYTSDMGTVIPQIKVDGVTTLKVTLAYPIDKNNTTADIASNNMYITGNGLNQNVFTATKETVKKGDTANTFYLYPSAQGTQEVWFTPSGNISETDHSIVHNVSQHLAVTYRETLSLSKVTGLKVANKKGAAVSVSWKSQGANVLYRVYKKVGSGKWVAKNVTSAKTSLKVKKGAKVTVKVKAYKKSDAGKTVWGPKATKKTFKTDKK